MLDARFQLFLQTHLFITEHDLSLLQKVILVTQRKRHREEYFSYEEQLRR